MLAMAMKIQSSIVSRVFKHLFIIEMQRKHLHILLASINFCQLTLIDSELAKMFSNVDVNHTDCVNADIQSFCSQNVIIMVMTHFLAVGWI